MKMRGSVRKIPLILIIGIETHHSYFGHNSRQTGFVRERQMSAIDKSEFKAEFHHKVNDSPAYVDRDLRRLQGLIEQYKRDGLNTIESNEKQELIEKYDMKHVDAFKLRFVK